MIEFYSPFSRKYLILTQNSADLRRTRIVDFAFGLVLLWDPKGSVVATDAFIPRRRVYRPDGSEGEATRKFCVSLRSLREAKGLLSARNKPNL